MSGFERPWCSLDYVRPPVEIQPEELRQRLEHAVRTVAEEQPELWELNAGEWAISGQVFLAMNSEAWPDGLRVDSEWDRQGLSGLQKRVGQGAKVRPDLVVHRRGSSEPTANLLVAEFKRAPLNSSKVGRDVGKVRGLMCEFGYQAGAVVSLGRKRMTDPIEAWWRTSVQSEPTYLKIAEPARSSAHSHQQGS